MIGSYYSSALVNFGILSVGIFVNVFALIALKVSVNVGVSFLVNHFVNAMLTGL